MEFDSLSWYTVVNFLWLFEYAGRVDVLHLYILDILITVWGSVRLPLWENVSCEREKHWHVPDERILCVQHTVRHACTCVLPCLIYGHHLLHGWLQENFPLLFPHSPRYNFDCNHQWGIVEFDTLHPSVCFLEEPTDLGNCCKSVNPIPLFLCNFKLSFQPRFGLM